MFWREIIAVCSQIQTKHINTVCGQNGEFVNVEPSDIYSDHWAAKCVKILNNIIKPELYLKTQSTPRSKHTPSRL